MLEDRVVPSYLPPPSGLVSWWPGDGNAFDIHGGNNGTLLGATSFTSAEVGQGFTFGSNSDGVTIPDNPNLNVQSTGFAVDFWIKGVHNQPNPLFLAVDKSHGWTDSTGWLFQGDSATGDLSFGIGIGGSGAGNFPMAHSGTDVLDGAFHHIAGTWDGNTIQIYVDGVPKGSQPLTTPANNNRPMNMGFSWGGGTPQRFFRGTVDEVDVFSRALSASEIQGIFSAGSAGKGRLALTPAGQAAGFSLSTFATGFPATSGNGGTGSHIAGPTGIAFPTSGGVLVGDAQGNVRLFPNDGDGQYAPTYPPVAGATYGLDNALGMAQVGTHIYMTQLNNGQVVEINPNGTLSQVIVTGVPLAAGIVANPTNGHLFVSTIGNNQIFEVDPIAKTKTLFANASFDGMAISPDGSILYGARVYTDPASQGHVWGYNTSTKALVFDSGFLGTVGIDGIALGTGPLAGNLFVNTNDGTVIEVNLTTLAQTTIATNGTRGDFVTVDPTNNTLLLTQSDAIVRMSPGNFLANKTNTTTVVTSSASNNTSVYGQSVTFTAAVSSVVVGSGTPSGTVTFTDGSTTLGTGTLQLVGGQDQATFSTSALAAGTHTITATYSGDPLFNTSTGTLTQTVTPRPLTVTASGVNKVYDGTTAATVTLSDNRVAGDVFTDSYTSASFADKNVGTGKAVSVSGISISGGASANYTLTNTTASTTASITARSLVISAAGVNKVYDGTTAATVTLSDNRVTGDVLTDSYASATFADNNVGTGKAVSVSGIAISGADAGNYTPNTTATTTANITPRPLSVTANDASRLYGVANPSFTGTLTGVASPDNITATYASAAVPGTAVGIYGPASANAIVPTLVDPGGRLSNYSVTSTNGTLTVTKRSTTTTVSFAANPINEGGSTVATVTVTDTSGSALVNVDPAGTVSLSATGPLTLGQTSATLTGNGAGVSTGQVTVTGVDNPGGTITASFPGDAVHQSGSNSAGLTVNNVAPTVGPITAPVSPTAVNTAISTSASFTDPGVLDTHTAAWSWGDTTTSAGTVTETNGSGSVTGSHTYTTDGVFTVTLTVTDKDGGQGQSVFQYVVIYNTGAGFVTGGGWITSPAGAYPANPTLSAKANFDFNAKYQSGTAVPTGQTEFQVKDANLNFHSTSYDWLVVTSPKFQYQGSGTINGGGNFGFL
jgi:hypothetical protein